jgi:hypothetical protein
LLSRQFKQRLLAEEAERQAAEDAAIMAALLIENGRMIPRTRDRS